MQNIKSLAQRYIDWLIRLGRVKFSLFGVVLLAMFALCVQMVSSLLIVGEIYWIDLLRSVTFGLMSAPFVIYFFAVLVERLEISRRQLARSVTELKKEVSERTQAESKLSVALDNLAKINRDKSNLMATISHELRTPLNGIIGLSRILLDSKLTDEQRGYLKTISVSAVSLGYIFNEIIDMEKIDADRIQIHRQPTDLSLLLNDIRHFGMLLATQKKLKFHCDITPHLPSWLMLDTVRLSQVLWNLINNAVKFTDQGEIRLLVRAAGEHRYEFTISDTGIGMPATELPHIFDMYYQIKNQPNPPLGSGIGLAVSKTLAKLMGGDLTVQSKEGNGSQFTLSIHAPPAQPPQHAAPRSFPSLRILLIEDLELNVLVARSVLEKLGHQVDTAPNGSAAIRQFERQDYDLVLIDIQLPDMTGFDIAAHLRHGYEHGIYDALPPLIAFTANVMHDEAEYRSKGMDGVLRKPLSLEELSHCLHELFGDDIDLPRMPNAIFTAETADDSLDYGLLTLLDTAQIAQNLALFEQTFPDYLVALRRCYDAYHDAAPHSGNLTALAATAHKIKGAAASMGLLKLRHIAAALEQTDAPDWHTAAPQWLAILETQWQAETDKLHRYLAVSAAPNQTML